MPVLERAVQTPQQPPRWSRCPALREEDQQVKPRGGQARAQVQAGVSSEQSWSRQKGMSVLSPKGLVEGGWTRAPQRS